MKQPETMRVSQEAMLVSLEFSKRYLLRTLSITFKAEQTELPEELAGTLNKIVGQIDVITKYFFS